MKTRNTLTNPALIALSALTLTACGGQTETTNNATTPAATADTEILLPVKTPDREPRVVGGTGVKSNKYPWMAAIVERNTNAAKGQFCGGSLIADKWILTAAHCIEDTKASKVSVLLGRTNLNGSGGETIKVKRIIEHPNYKSKGYPDIALLELLNPSSVKPVLLPTRANQVAENNALATVTGWGQVSENGQSSNRLLEANVPIVAHNQCKTAYRGFENIVKDAMVCAGTKSGNKDSCYGDSGGPLFIKKGSDHVQAGVVSFGKKCGLANVPGVYARVSSYHDWISAYANVSTYEGTNGPETPTKKPNIDVTCDGLNCTMTANNFGSGDYYWDFGDGYGDEGRTINYAYEVAGDYTVYFGFVSTNGEYQEKTKQISVTDNGSTNSKIPQFTGRLQGRGDQEELPLGGDPIAMSAGNLTATLTVPKKRRFALFLDRYDATTDEWYEVARVRSKNGKAALNLPIEAGEYGFTVQSLSRGGRYKLDASIK